MTPIKVCRKNAPQISKALAEMPGSNPCHATNPDMLVEIANLAECRLIAMEIPPRKRANAVVYGRDQITLFDMVRRSRSWFLTGLREARNSTGPAHGICA